MHISERICARALKNKLFYDFVVRVKENFDSGSVKLSVDGVSCQKLVDSLIQGLKSISRF